MERNSCSQNIEERCNWENNQNKDLDGKVSHKKIIDENINYVEDIMNEEELENDNERDKRWTSHTRGDMKQIFGNMKELLMLNMKKINKKFLFFSNSRLSYSNTNQDFSIKTFVYLFKIIDSNLPKDNKEVQKIKDEIFRINQYLKDYNFCKKRTEEVSKELYDYKSSLQELCDLIFQEKIKLEKSDFLNFYDFEDFKEKKISFIYYLTKNLYFLGLEETTKIYEIENKQNVIQINKIVLLKETPCKSLLI